MRRPLLTPPYSAPNRHSVTTAYSASLACFPQVRCPSFEAFSLAPSSQLPGRALRLCPSLHITYHSFHPLLRLLVLNWGHFALQENVQRSFLLSQWERRAEGCVLLVLGEQRLGTLSTILQCTGNDPATNVSHAEAEEP